MTDAGFQNAVVTVSSVSGESITNAGRVAVYSSEERFPAEDPFNALVIGDDRREVQLAAASLDLGR